MKISIVKNTSWAVFHAMDNFSSGFIAQISYLEEKNAKIWKNSPWGNFGIFWEIFWFLGYFPNFIFFYFLKIKKIIFEKNQRQKLIRA
jgi:hypothetical protein